MFKRMCAATLLVVAFRVQDAHAQYSLLTSNAGAPTPTNTLVFPTELSSFSTATLANGVVITATGGNGYLYSGAWGVPPNGTWDGSNGRYAAENDVDGAMRFTFTTGQVFFSAFMNYQPFATDEFLRAFDQAGNLLVEYNISDLAPIYTPFNSVNDGDVRGISSVNADMYAFEIAGSYSVARDIEYSSAPEPASFVLLGTGLVGVAGIARRRRVR